MMTPEYRDEHCYCDYEHDVTCSVCERYYDDHCEEFEEAKRKRIAEEQEY